jgi:type II secretory pathway component PulF
LRNLGIVTCACSAVAGLAVFVLAFIVPNQIARAYEAGRAVSAAEKALFSLSNLATRYGLVGLVVVLLGMASGVALVIMSGRSEAARSWD